MRLRRWVGWALLAAWGACTPVGGAQSVPQARLVAQLGHHELVSAVAFSPDGRTVLTGSWDKTARLWEASSGKELQRFEGHSKDVYSAVFSPDGRSVLTASLDGTARIWDAASGKEMLRVQADPGGVFAAVFSPDGKNVLTGGHDTTARLWEASSGKELRRIKTGLGVVSAVAFSPDGRSMLTGNDDGTTRLYSVATGKELLSFVAHGTGAEPKGVDSVAFSPDGRSILTGNKDKSARIWDAATGKLLRRLEDAAEVRAVAFSPDSRSLLMAGAGGTFWYQADGKILGSRPGGAWSATFSPDGRMAVAGDDFGVAHLWDLSSGKEERKFLGYSIEVLAVAFSPNGGLLATGGSSETVQLWDTARGQETLRLTGHKGVVEEMVFSPDSRKVLTASGDGTARLWNTETGESLQQFQGRYGFMSAAFWANDAYVLAGNMDGTATLFETKSGLPVQRYDAGSPKGNASNWITAVGFTPDGQDVLTGSQDGTARIWDAVKATELHRYQANDKPVDAAVFSSDGTTLLTGGWDDTAHLWDVASGKELRQFVGHTDIVSAAVFSPDGKYVLTGSWDKTARLWDAATGKELLRFEGHANTVYSVAFAPDGKHVLTGSLDGTTRLWDTSTGKEVASLVSFSNGGWAVVDAQGRFDTSDLDGGAPLQWVVEDDPMRALPLEIFMRDYYTPGLLSRVMRGEKLPEVQSIAEIKNRVQPEVKVVSVASSRPGRVDVTVHGTSVTDAKGVKSGLHDLRLFRDGQMVADGYRTGELADGDIVFRDVMLKSDAKKVTFTAYAFNNERIKSATASLDYEVKEPVSPAVKRRAFLLQVGVNHTAAKGCELKYSVNDAEKMSATLGEKLRAQGFDVEAVKLESAESGDTNAAGKETIHMRLKEIAVKATPDDAFFMSFSGHGYSRVGGAFYILPSSLKGDCSHVDEAMLQTAISADELADWLRPIDAGEMTLILDACYSAESVQAGDFKPGPMGSLGLGQMAYDKRMRVLAASQSDAVAHEYDYLHEGLLSYVLVQDGLEKREADWNPKDGKIKVGEWLSYAARAVPEFKATSPTGENKGTLVEKPATGLKVVGQVPALFDFSREDSLVLAK